MKTFSSLLSSWCFSLSFSLCLLSELILLFVHHHRIKMCIKMRLMKISFIIIIVGLKHVKLDDYIGYCSSQVFIILLFRHRSSIASSLSIPFYEWKMLLPVLRSSFLLLSEHIVRHSLHKENAQMRDSLLKRPNCPLSRIHNTKKKLKNHSMIIDNNFLNVFQTFHLSAIFRKFDQFTGDHSPENS